MSEKQSIEERKEHLEYSFNYALNDNRGKYSENRRGHIRLISLFRAFSHASSEQDITYLSPRSKIECIDETIRMESSIEWY